MRSCCIIAVLAFLLYALTVCPTVPFGDGGELIAAAHAFGVAHPPGYPLYTALGWLALRLPFGEPALGMNLMSALFGGLACGTLAWLVLRLTASRIAAFAAALAFAASSTFWSVANAAEVYSLHVFLMLVLLSAAAAVGDAPGPDRRGRALFVAATALGLGLAHHPTIVLALPAALLLAARPAEPRLEARPRLAERIPRVRRGWAIASLLVVVGLPFVLYLTLMLRARSDPAANWGRPVDLERLWAHASAAIYRHRDLGWTSLLRPGGWRTVIEALVLEMTPWILPLAAVGWSGRPRSLRPSGWGRMALASGALVVAGAIFGLRYVASDFEVFLFPAFIGLALAASAAIAGAAAHRLAAVRTAGITAAALLVLLALGAHFGARNLMGRTGARDYAGDVLAALPQGAALFVETDDSFPLLYVLQVLDRRPDVAVYDRQGVLWRDVAREMRLQPLPGESLLDYRIRAEQAFIDRELSRAPPREVYFLGWPGYDVPPRYRMEPVGLVYRIARSDQPIRDDASLWAGYHERSVGEQALRTGNGAALAIAAIYPMARGERALFLNDRPVADAALREAAELTGCRWEVCNYIGTLYGRIGDYTTATEMFERTLEVEPVSLRAWNNLAMARELAGDVDGARRALRRALELEPGQPEARAKLERLEGRALR